MVEPQGSQWYLPDGERMNTRVDGGPTSWQAMIVTANPTNSHREYAIEFQDMQLAYTAESNVGPKGSNELVHAADGQEPGWKPECPVGVLHRPGEKVRAIEHPETNLKEFIVNGLNKAKLPENSPNCSLSYGITLSPNAKVTVLSRATLQAGIWMDNGGSISRHWSRVEGERR